MIYSDWKAEAVLHEGRLRGLSLGSITQAFRSNWLFLALIVLAFALRAVWLLSYPAVIENEGGAYATIAKNILQNRGFVSVMGVPETMYAPLYPLLIAGFCRILGDAELAGRLVSLALGTALVAILYKIAARLYGRATACIAAALAACHPLLIGFSVAVYTEVPYIAIMMAGGWAALRCLYSPSIWRAGLSGVCFGLAYLIRPEAIVFPFVLTLVVMLLSALKCLGFRQALRCSLAFIAACWLIAIPYIIFLWLKLGKVQLDGKTLINYTISRRVAEGMSYNHAAWGIDHNMVIEGPLLDPFRFSGWSPYKAGILRVITTMMGAAKRNYAVVLGEILPSFALGSPVLLMLAVIGWFGQKWNLDRLLGEVMLGAMAAYSSVVLLAAHTIQSRYALPLLPFLLLWAARGITLLANWVTESVGLLPAWQMSARRRMGFATAILAGALMLGFAGVGVRYISELTQGSRANLGTKQAGIWLRSAAPGLKTVMDVTTVIPYYAEADLMGMPYCESEQALRFIHLKAPDFIVLQGANAFKRPYLASWLRNGIPDSAARAVFRAGESTDEEIVIYRWDAGREQLRGPERRAANDTKWN